MTRKARPAVYHPAPIDSDPPRDRVLHLDESETAIVLAHAAAHNCSPEDSIIQILRQLTPR